MSTHFPTRLTVDVRQKSFNGRVIIRDVAFSVAAGEIVAVLGASGCGKSTLLRAIAGLDTDFVGKIAIHGTHNNVVGMVYQEPRLMPWLTVEENIGFGLGAKSKSVRPRIGRTGISSNSKIREASIDDLLQEVMLENARQSLPKQLSGGMAQRVSIARALVREPDVLLMDEPFSSLDVLTRRSLHTLTRNITAKHKTATVIVTHDPDEAVNLADRVLVLTKSLAKDGNGSATIQHDIRPSADKAARHAEIDAIIAALESTQTSEAA